ncbi:hypothetical protein NDU88_004140 [Pleurodeles waltl]|uniref:Uncharacterized protein n=1 Tax=Pleurodeles waltl TaxID=8319 RepID=A0AAV7VHE6_PLEWA|nr:hypothetical protein NDU88_004140 [Pleurodeles waltl]
MQELSSNVKEIRRNVGELEQRVDSLEQSQDSWDEEVEEDRRELLNFRDKTADLNYQLEDLENRSQRCNICIKGVPLQAESGKLGDSVCHLFHHVVPDRANQIIIDGTHRVGWPFWTPSQPKDVLTCLHYYQ